MRKGRGATSCWDEQWNLWQLWEIFRNPIEFECLPAIGRSRASGFGTQSTAFPASVCIASCHPMSWRRMVWQRLVDLWRLLGLSNCVPQELAGVSPGVVLSWRTCRGCVRRRTFRLGGSTIGIFAFISGVGANWSRVWSVCARSWLCRLWRHELMLGVPDRALDSH